ncbi:DUF3592 domain-containing protein [Massilia sp. SR12]
MRDGVLAAVLAAVMLLGGCYNRAQDVAQLVRQHAVAAGRVALLECRQNGRWWYDFTVEGKRRRGMSNDPAGCATRHVGDAVPVYYNPADPALHRAVLPAAAYAAEHGWYVPEWLWFGLGALALPLSALMALRRGSKG